MSPEMLTDRHQAVLHPRETPLSRRYLRVLEQEVLFVGLPDGLSLCWERLTAREPITVESLQQGFLRIVNENFSGITGNCHGFRTIHTPEGKERFAGYVDADPHSDLIRTYDHPAWLDVDGRLGLVFQGTGQTVYHNRHYFETWWAVADDLVLSRLEHPFRARAGATIGQLATLIAPDRSARQTAALQLIELRASGRAAGLLAGSYLAAANFESKRRTVRLSAPRAQLDRVPVFAGTTRTSSRSVTCSLVLNPGASTLRKALMTLDVDGQVEISAAETGQVTVRNIGKQTATLAAGSRDEKLRLRPGAVAALR